METPSSAATATATAATSPVATAPPAITAAATPTTAATPPVAEPKPYLGAPAADGKPAAPADADAKSEPPVYDLAVPDGSGLTPADIEGIKAFATANKLSPEIAQAVLNRDATRVGERAQANVTAQRDAVTAWNAENSKDPLIGGEKSPQMERVRQFVAKHWSPAFLTLLHNTGLGSHPDFLRGLVKASEGRGESTLAANVQPPATKTDPLRARYDHPSSSALFRDGKQE